MLQKKSHVEKLTMVFSQFHKKPMEFFPKNRLLQDSKLTQITLPKMPL